MGNRQDLHDILLSLLGSSNVYFQPPPSYKLLYPCIVYNRSKIYTKFANNDPYSHAKQYVLTVIDKDPDSELPDKVAKLHACRFNRHFVSDGLNHDVFEILF